LTEGTEEIGERINYIDCPSCGRKIDLSAAPALTSVGCPACGGRMFVPVDLGQYRLVALLGKGTTAAAYRGIDRELDRQVAVKVMHLESKGDDDAVNRFLAEARALAALRHRNVVRIFTMGMDHHVPYLVMELIGGGSVRKLIDKDKPISEARGLEIAIAVAEGLQAAHGIGLIHGDVKPGNVLLDEQGVPKLVDFGLARFGGVKMGSEGMGTPFYVAPERIRQRDTDHRSDIYSLGCSLYHLLTGVPVFDGKTVKDVLLGHVKRTVVDPRHHRPFLGAKTAALLMRTLEKDPAKRQATYDELLADLRDALQCAAPVGEAAAPPANGGKAELAAAAAALASAGQTASPRPSTPSRAAPQAPASGNGSGRPTAPTAPERRGPTARPAAARKDLYKMLLVGGAVLAAAAVVGLVLMVVIRAQKPPSGFNMYPTTSEPALPAPAYVEPPPVDPPPPDPISENPGGLDPFSGLITQARDGSFELRAAVAKIAGKDQNTANPFPRYELAKDCVGFWMVPEGRVSWDIEVLKGGNYEVIVEHACDKNCAGGEYVLTVGGQTLSLKVPATGGWEDFRPSKPGRVTLATGKQTVSVSGKLRRNGNKWVPLMNIRSVRLDPAN